MAQKSLGYVEMVWTCPNCQAKNRGSVRYCSSCGAAQPKDVQFERPLSSELVADPEKISEATSGPDIYCAYCGNRNPSTAKSCQNCGADLEEGEARESGAVYAGPTGPVEKTVTCGVCGTENPVSALKCAGCGSPLSTTVKAEPAAPAPRPKGKSTGCIIAAVILAALIGVILFLFLKTNSLTARVTEKNWETSVNILELVPKTGTAWCDEVPSDGKITNRYRSPRKTSSSYIAGAEEECGEPYFVDQGNGYSKEVQDCTYTVYDDECEYTYKAWDVVDTRTASGSDNRPYFPDLNLIPGQREGKNTTNYRVEFADDAGKEYLYSPGTLEEYTAFELDQRYALEVNLVGGVVKYELQ